MKKAILFALALGFSVGAKADWKQELEDYKQWSTTATDGQLLDWYVFNYGKMYVTCGASYAMTFATAFSDTMPVSNLFAEALANNANPEYNTVETSGLLDTLMAWENWAQAARGTAGGGVTAAMETFAFLNQYLSGNTEAAYHNLKENYKSTLATYEALFAEKGQCARSSSKIAIIYSEMMSRRAKR